MEVVFALPILLLPFIMPLLSGMMAKSFGRKFWPWFFIGIPLPFIANIILLCLPDKTKQVAPAPCQVPQADTYDHLFLKENPKCLN